MCPACWIAMITNGLIWLSGALGITYLGRWMRFNVFTKCKCKKCKNRDLNKSD